MIRPARSPRRVRTFATIGAGILLAGMLALVVWEVSRARCFALTGPVVCRVARPMVALSFDDGPTQAGLDAVLPVLEAHGAEATFFLIGREAAARHVEDPRIEDPAAFADEAVARARPGSIILLHAMYPANATAREALPSILAGLRAKGLRVVGVSTLLEVAS
ncbi:MAG: polysaccharide deacetylase family protein [Phenylobacterium sp.]|uniref:polysaccharide deacetylase family protein n=1 Tax=Phenylobacterium sp. TaxID=1871053 RepID=UPI002A35C31E|nr:polysaccharide deacetylase family protein [Phenylobacterium sp.]MDX9998042.1 polysaccharide deacetylase family protein [Phenylobacterium sp.]